MTGMPPKRDPLRGQKTLRVTDFLEEFEVDDIKRKVDIVELFESFGVKLTKSGKSFKGFCPWHKDSKTPSLSISREKGLFHCFGCDEGGTVVDAVMKFKNVDFKEALKFLKGWSGSPVKELPLPVPEDGRQTRRKTSVYRKQKLS